MKSRKIIVFIMLFSLLIISFSFLIGDTIEDKRSKKIYNICVITRVKNDESMMITKKGIDQAASDFRLTVKVINLSNNNDIDNQREIVDREIKNGVDAIILSPIDYNKSAKVVENASKKVPVILIESTVNLSNRVPTISCDNYKLGKDLAEEMKKMGDMGKKIAIIKNNFEPSSIKERYDGFMSIMKDVKNKYENWVITDDKDQSYYNQISNLLNNNDVDVIVTFSSIILENIAEVKKSLYNLKQKDLSIKVYGTGSTSKIISFLEDKIINATAIQNEFNIGYLGVKSAVDKINGKNVRNGIISSTVINAENMYSKENQKLLFPLVR